MTASRGEADPAGAAPEAAPAREAAGEELPRGRPRRLLFVCTGNTCRSPMAEAIARAEARERGFDGVECRSAGTFGFRGEPPSEMAEIVARGRGLDLGTHRSSPLVPELVAWADLVLGMGRSHVEIARELDPGARVELVTSFLREDHPFHEAPVTDPMGGTLEDYEETFDLLREAVRALFDRLEDG